MIKLACLQFTLRSNILEEAGCTSFRAMHIYFPISSLVTDSITRESPMITSSERKSLIFDHQQFNPQINIIRNNSYVSDLTCGAPYHMSYVQSFVWHESCSWYFCAYDQDFLSIRMVWKNDIYTRNIHISTNRIFMIYFKYANQRYQPFLFAPTCFLFGIFLTSGFLLHVIVGAGWPLAEQKNFACPPSLTLMSLELNLSDISGGTTTSNVATCKCQKTCILSIITLKKLMSKFIIIYIT